MKTLVPIKKNGQLSPSLFEFPKLDPWFDNLFDSRLITTPSVNVIENEGAYLIDVATPGFNKSNFNIEINGDKLEVSAESSMENNQDDLNYKKREFSYSSFKRSFSLPKNVEHDKISADYVDGILKISIPKSNNKDSPNRRIEIG